MVKKQIKKTKKKAGNIIDAIKDPIGYVKDIVSSNPYRYNFSSQKVLDKYGTEPIKTLKVARTPLGGALRTAINTLSFGKFDNLASSQGHDVLYHLSLIWNNHIILEKNEVVTIALLSDSSSLNKNTEYMDVKFNPLLVSSLNQMLNNTRLKMGDDKFFGYSGLGNNNCQNWCLMFLESNHISSPELKKFIFQDFSQVKKELDNSGYSYLGKTMDAITGLASKASRIIAKGKRKDNSLSKENFNKLIKKIGEKVIKSVMDNKFNFL